MIHYNKEEWKTIVREIENSHLTLEEILRAINREKSLKRNRGGRPSKIEYYLRRYKHASDKQRIINEARKNMCKTTFRKFCSQIFHI